MGRIIASCGHELSDEEGVGNPVEYAEWVMDRSYEDGGMKEAIIYAVMCKECLKKKWLKKAMKRALVLKDNWLR